LRSPVPIAVDDTIVPDTEEEEKPESTADEVDVEVPAQKPATKKRRPRPPPRELTEEEKAVKELEEKKRKEIEEEIGGAKRLSEMPEMGLGTNIRPPTVMGNKKKRRRRPRNGLEPKPEVKPEGEEEAVSVPPEAPVARDLETEAPVEKVHFPGDSDTEEEEEEDSSDEEGPDFYADNSDDDDSVRGPSRGHFKTGKAFVNLSKMIFSEPVIIPTPYGETWSMDVFALPHNGIRRELVDLYKIMESLVKRHLDLRHSDIDDFYNWWEVFEGFVLAHFDLEEKVVFPWVTERVGLAKTSVGKASRMVTKGRITRLMREVADLEERFVYSPAGEILPRLYGLVEKFTPRLLAYFGEVEKIVPSRLDNCFQPKDKKVLDSKVMNAVMKSKFSSELVVLLTRWLPDGHLTPWKRNNLKGLGRVSYGMWKSEMEKRHFAPVEDFVERLAEFKADEVRRKNEKLAAESEQDRIRRQIEEQRAELPDLPPDARLPAVGSPKGYENMRMGETGMSIRELSSKKIDEALLEGLEGSEDPEATKQGLSL